MAVAVDAVSSAETQSGVGVTTATHTNLTIGASLSNGAVIFGVAWDTKVTSPTAHWDSTGTNQLMTLLGTVNTAGTNGTVAIFGLRNPTSGNKTFSTSWTTASIAAIFGISFTGVDQTSDAAAFKNFNSATGNSTAPSVAITSAVNDIVVGAFVNSNNATDWSSVNNTTLCVNAGIQLAMNRAAGAASVTMSGVLTSADQWAATGIDVAAVSAAVTDLRNMWFQPWREPVRRRTAADLEQRALAFVPVVVTPSPGPGATVAGADIAGPTFTKTFIYQAKAQTLLAPEDVARFQWGNAWPDRVRIVYEFDTDQQFLAWSGFTPSTATPTGWNDPLEVPVRNWQRSPIYSAQFLAWSPAPDAFGWFTPLSEPVRIVASPAKQQVLALAPNPIVATGWSVTLSEPVRVKQRAIADYTYAPLSASEVITIDKWYNPLAPPVLSRLAAVNYQPWTFLEPAPQVWFPYDRWADTTPRAKRVAQNPDWFYGTFVTPAFIPTYTQWTQWPDFAPRAKSVVDFIPWPFLEPAPQVFFPYAPWDDFARKKPPPLDTQPLAWSTFTPAAVVTDATVASADIAGPTFTKSLIYQVTTQPINFTAAPVINTWSQWPDFAPRAKRAADFTPWTFIPTPRQVFFPYAPWDDFARRKQPPLDTQPLAWNSLQITTPAPIMAWVRWPDFAPRARPATDAPSSVFLALVPSATTVQDWADFVLRKPPPLDTQPLIWTGQNIAAPAPTMAWVRWPDFAPAKPVPLNYNPLALVQLASQVFFPYAPWDDFTRRKPQFPDTQPIAGPINFVVEVTLVSKWFEGLSMPPGPKSGLGTYLQSSYTNDTIAAAIQLFARARWYAPLSEPVRRKGLRPEFQKFIERDIFVANFYLASLNATEQGDFLVAVLAQFNTPISAYVDIVQNDPRQRGNLGVIENVAQSSIIASITEPQTVPATGQPVSTVAGARVAIIVT